MLKKFLSCSIGGWLAMVIGFITVPVTTRLFNPDDFGRLAMFSLFVSVISTIVGMGMLNAYVRFFYEEVAENRKRLLFKCVKYPICLITLTSIGIALFSQFISNYIVNEIDYHVVICLILAVLFECIGTFADWTVRMQERGKIFSLLTFLRRFLNFILIIGFYKLAIINYSALIYAFTIASGVVTSLGIFFERNIWSFDFIFQHKRLNDAKHTSSEIVRYAVPFLFSNIISWIFSSCDRVAINHWSGLEELGIYSAAFSITAILTVLQNSITTFIGPIIMKKYEGKDNVDDFLIKISDIVTVLMFGFAILLLLFKDIVIFILGEKYREAVYLMPLLVFAPVMYTISETTFYGIIFKKKSKAHLYVSIVASLVSVIGNVILVPEYGARGAVIATAIAWIMFFIMRTWFSAKYYQIKYSFVKIGWLTLCLFMYSMYLTFYNDTYISTIIGIATLVCLFILYRNLITGYYIFIMEKIRWKISNL